MKTRLMFISLFATLPILLVSAGTMIIASMQFTQIQKPEIQSPVSSESDPDKTLSPYFFVKSDSPNLDQLPLKATSAEVSIAGVIADVSVVQEYANEGKKPVEAIYVFPASTRAAVYSMKMMIGERTITAKISEREQARRDYEAAKQEGKSASLLEQERPVHHGAVSGADPVRGLSTYRPAGRNPGTLPSGEDRFEHVLGADIRMQRRGQADEVGIPAGEGYWRNVPFDDGCTCVSCIAPRFANLA